MSILVEQPRQSHRSAELTVIPSVRSRCARRRRQAHGEITDLPGSAWRSGIVGEVYAVHAGILIVAGVQTNHRKSASGFRRDCATMTTEPRAQPWPRREVYCAFVFDLPEDSLMCCRRKRDRVRISSVNRCASSTPPRHMGWRIDRASRLGDQKEIPELARKLGVACRYTPIAITSRLRKARQCDQDKACATQGSRFAASRIRPSSAGTRCLRPWAGKPFSVSPCKAWLKRLTTSRLYRLPLSERSRGAGMRDWPRRNQLRRHRPDRTRHPARHVGRAQPSGKSSGGAHRALWRHA